ncbi:MAG: anion permease [bacterium]|nr:anion permease [bacterium]
MPPPAIILLIAAAAGLYMAWNIGANDLANAMGTSVGSGALTLKQAVIIAAVFELAGAVLVGSHVTETVRKGMVDPAVFAPNPNLILWGMTSALLAAAIWLQVATALGMPVSTTHSIVGAVVGFGLVGGGLGAIRWAKIGLIAASWIFSPLVGGAIAFGLFVFIRRRILEAPDPLASANRYAPWFIFVVAFILVLSFIYKGLKNLHLNFPLPQALVIAAAAGLACTFIGRRFISRAVLSPADADGRPTPSVEGVFRYLQIVTAGYVAFAHGSNDTANAIGPLAAILGVLRHEPLGAQVEVPTWVLLLGGMGIVLGLATYGYKVIETIGKKITHLTHASGFAAQFAAATTILVGSKLSLPLSTTHTIVGAVVGVGLARGIAALNLRMLRNIANSWLITLPFTAVLTIILYKLALLITGG